MIAVRNFFLMDCRLGCIAPLQMAENKTVRDKASRIEGYN